MSFPPDLYEVLHGVGMSFLVGGRHNIEVRNSFAIRTSPTVVPGRLFV